MKPSSTVRVSPADAGPLAGRTILVTRPAGQSEELVRALRRRRATAILAPAIEIVPARAAVLTRALHELGDQADYIEVAKIVARMNGTEW